jgi:hypothetical protein
MTKDEREHKSRLASMGCMVCRRLIGDHEAGPVELHHQRGGRGGWGKGDYKTLIPLCHEHHQGDTGVHGLGTKAFARVYGFTESDLLDDVRRIFAANQPKALEFIA